ncbi:MAG: hypothetical protein EBX50_23040 [Chitinophagia bacterium]|nr:hypothetical protein [Chitinophagia bacterium]
MVSASNNVTFISIITNASSSCTILGDMPYNGVASTPITISNGQGWSLGVQNGQNTLSGITITWISGSIDVMMGF